MSQPDTWQVMNTQDFLVPLECQGVSVSQGSFSTVYKLQALRQEVGVLGAKVYLYVRMCYT